MLLVSSGHGTWQRFESASVCKAAPFSVCKSLSLCFRPRLEIKQKNSSCPVTALTGSEESIPKVEMATNCVWRDLRNKGMFGNQCSVRIRCSHHPAVRGVGAGCQGPSPPTPEIWSYCSQLTPSMWHELFWLQVQSLESVCFLE